METITVSTRGRGLVDITSAVRAIVATAKVDTALANIFVRHTSASLIITENADPAVLRDLERWLSALAPENARYEHAEEGPDDMPAHLRAAITKTSETIPIRNGKLLLGTWQALYLFEHRATPHERHLIITIHS